MVEEDPRGAGIGTPLVEAGERGGGGGRGEGKGRGRQRRERRAGEQGS